MVIRTRQRLAALAVRGPAIVLNILRYAHELRDPADLEIPKDSAKALGLTEKEVALAEQLVESMTSKWKPEAYGDDYQKAKVEAWLSAERYSPNAPKPRRGSTRGGSSSSAVKVSGRPFRWITEKARCVLSS